MSKILLNFAIGKILKYFAMTKSFCVLAQILSKYLNCDVFKSTQFYSIHNLNVLICINKIKKFPEKFKELLIFNIC